MNVRCAGRPVVIQDREAPTEYDVEPSCGWSGEVAPVALGRCPGCGGVLEPVEISGAEAREGAGMEAGTQALEQLQQARDRLADLEAYAAELRELLAAQVECSHFRGLDCPDCEPVTPGVAAALAATPPERGRALVAELGRLREVAWEYVAEHGAVTPEEWAVRFRYALGEHSTLGRREGRPA